MKQVLRWISLTWYLEIPALPWLIQRLRDFKDAFSVPLGINQLPYDSEIMSATRDAFDNPDKVDDFINKMSRKLDYYEDLLRQRGNHKIWKRLSTGASEESRVVGLSLDHLP